jgi:hypothetical protein
MVSLTGSTSVLAQEEREDPAAKTPTPPSSEVIGIAERERASGRRTAHPVPSTPTMDVANPEMVDLMVDVRREMNLPADRDLVLELMRAEVAPADVREYGVVLTNAERDALKRHRTTTAQARTLTEELHKTGVYAGGRVIDGTEPFTWSSLEIMVTDPESSALRDALQKSDLPVDIKLVPVRSTWEELEQSSDAIRSAVRSPEQSLPDELADFVRSEDVVDVGYSIASNEVQLTTRDASLVGRSLETAGLPNLTYIKWEPSFDDSMCANDGCGGPRAGTEIEMTGSNVHCTLSLPVKSSGNEDYTTADHCDTTAWDLQVPAWSSLNHSVDRQLGTFNTANPTSSRVDADIIPTADHLVTDRLFALANRGQQISGSTPYGNNLIGDRVCQSGASTGISCGSVLDIGRSKTNTVGTALTSLVETNYLRQGGDSGAPVYSETNPSIVYGWHQGRAQGDPVFSSISFLGDLQANTSLFTTNDTRRDWLLKLYSTGLSRLPASGEYNYWRNTINGGACDINRARDTMWVFFLTAPEFGNSHPDNSPYRRKQRIRLLYWNAFGRDAATHKQDYWDTIYLSHGWDDIVYSIIFSTEFSLVYSGGHSSYDGRIC